MRLVGDTPACLPNNLMINCRVSVDERRSDRHPGSMVETLSKPGYYWDCREAAWVRCPVSEGLVPAPSEPADDRVSDAVDAVTADAPAG